MSIQNERLSRRAALGALASVSLATRAFGQKIEPLPDSGFTPLFDGKTMEGWDGDPKFWRVENGALVGETTTEIQPSQNTFLIYRKASPANFEIQAEYKLTGFNSGIQYRSVELPDIRWAMQGYQADIDGQQTYTGQIYEERNRGFLALRGQSTYVSTGQKPGLIGSLGTSEELKAVINADGWNQMRIIARGNILIQYINGRMMSMLIDDDDVNRKMSGLIGIQVHKGPSMKIEVRKIDLKNL